MLTAIPRRTYTRIDFDASDLPECLTYDTVMAMVALYQDYVTDVSRMGTSRRRALTGSFLIGDATLTALVLKEDADAFMEEFATIVITAPPGGLAW